MALLDETQLGERLDRFEAKLFRMERLPEYVVDSDGGDYERWLSGAAEPTWSRKQSWLDVLRAERAAGKVSSRVRVLSERPTDYERYACEWGYALNAAAGEDIRVLRVGEHAVPPWLGVGDWWLVDDREVVAMYYDPQGRFEGAEVLATSAAKAYRRARDEAWAAAEPFGQWWARHPELHRKAAA